MSWYMSIRAYGRRGRGSNKGGWMSNSPGGGGVQGEAVSNAPGQEDMSWNS